MAINWQQIVGGGQAPEDVEAAQRRLALAEALQAKSLQGSAPRSHGRVVAKYGTTHALADLANTVVAGRNVGVAEKRLAERKDSDAAKLSEAIANYQRAVPDEQVGQAAVQELRRTPDDQLMNPVTSQSETFAGLGKAGGLDGQKAIAEALMKRHMDATDPSTIADREVKLYQIQGLREDKRMAAEAKVEAAKVAAMQTKSSQQIAAMQVEVAREAERGRNERAEADRKARTAASTDKEKDKQDGRRAALEATQAAMVRMQTVSDNLANGGGPMEGRMPALGTLTQDFDGAKAQLLASIQSALRVPGIGSQSNMELLALMAALPERTQNNDVRDEQIKGINERLRIILQRELGTEAVAPAPITSGAGRPAPAAMKYSDPNEEAAYQAWKAAQGGG